VLKRFCKPHARDGFGSHTPFTGRLGLEERLGGAKLAQIGTARDRLVAAIHRGLVVSCA